MTFQIHEQYLDTDSGFHVTELRNGKTSHIVQIPVRHDSCPACGHVMPKALDGIDPKAMVAEVIEALNASHAAMHEYAQKHGIPIK